MHDMQNAPLLEVFHPELSELRSKCKGKEKILGNLLHQEVLRDKPLVFQNIVAAQKSQVRNQNPVLKPVPAIQLPFPFNIRELAGIWPFYALQDWPEFGAKIMKSIFAFPRNCW
jgi:hypothetical protein